MDNNGQWAAITFLAALILTLLLVRFAMRGPFEGNASFQPVIVEVRGDVEHPGVHLIDRPSATVADALEAAGSPAGPPSAAGQNSFLHRSIHTGELIRVTRRPEGRPDVEVGQMEAGARLTLGIKLDLNAAGEEELQLVPQMKPELASAIAERRKQKPWRSVDELVEIPGVGPKTVEKWKVYLEVATKSFEGIDHRFGHRPVERTSFVLRYLSTNGNGPAGKRIKAASSRENTIARRSFTVKTRRSRRSTGSREERMDESCR